MEKGSIRPPTMLEKEMAFYGSYHRHPTNIGIHLIFVPVIFFTSLVFAANTGELIPGWSYSNLGVLTAIGYGVSYLLFMDSVAGLLCLPLIVGGALQGTKFLQADASLTNKVSLVLFVTGWVTQFLGHGVWEKRAPALKDNLLQALYFAPFFVWMEILFALGYRKELYQRLQAIIEANVPTAKSL